MNNLADAILQNTPQNPDELNSLLREVQMQELDSTKRLLFYQRHQYTTHERTNYCLTSYPACEIHLLRSAKLFGGPFNFNESDGKITKLQLSRLLAELLEETTRLPLPSAV